MHEFTRILRKIPGFGPLVSTLISRWYWRWFGYLQSPAYWIAKIPNSHARIVEIGSNDGRQGDPLYEILKTRRAWNALFVEPVPYVFERLRKNYQDRPNCHFANTAINNGERMDFYYVDPVAQEQLEDLDFRFDQLGSFYRENIVRHMNGKLEPFIVKREIQGIRLMDLLDKYGFQDITVLLIDTEGYDWKVLSQLDLKRYTPEIIVFEHLHLSNAERAAAIGFLQASYLLYSFKADVMAIRRTSPKVLRKKLWALRSRRVRSENDWDCNPFN